VISGLVVVEMTWLYRKTVYGSLVFLAQFHFLFLINYLPVINLWICSFPCCYVPHPGPIQ
jgi:hypothetical protein